jgi:hypothetical protein
VRTRRGERLQAASDHVGKDEKNPVLPNLRRHGGDLRRRPPAPSLLAPSSSSSLEDPPGKAEVVAAAAGSSPLRDGGVLPGSSGAWCLWWFQRRGAAGARWQERQGGVGGGTASYAVDSPVLAADLRSPGGEGLISARVSRDVIGMEEAASRQNKGAEARSPSRQGHLWLWRAVGLVSSQIYGFGEGGLSERGRLSTLPWSFGSLFGSRRAADAIVFPLAGHGGEGVEGDATTAFLFRVAYCLFLRCDCLVLKLLPTGHGGEGRR